MADANMPHRVEREWTAADKDWSDIDLVDNCGLTGLWVRDLTVLVIGLLLVHRVEHPQPDAELVH